MPYLIVMGTNIRYLSGAFGNVVGAAVTVGNAVAVGGMIGVVVGSSVGGGLTVGIAVGS